jgi:quinol-cytochrome oxidoreductase complex cytochrome b subunit
MTDESKAHRHEEGEPFFPHHMLEQGMVIFIVLGVLVLLVMLWPAPMEPPADPFNTPAHIKPEWYFLSAYQGLKLAEYFSFLGSWAPKVLGILGQGIGILLLILLPFLDRNPQRNPRKRPFVIKLGILALIIIAALTIWGKLS